MEFSNKSFYRELESGLPKSSAAQRKIWANTLSEMDMDMKPFYALLRSEKKIALRFLWLLSELGYINPIKLRRELPYLLELCEEQKQIDNTCFALFWLLAGVPDKNEGKATNLLFQWLQSAETNVSIKSRCILVLFQLTKKYPDLKNELKLCIQDQMEKYSPEFKKRAGKILKEL